MRLADPHLSLGGTRLRDERGSYERVARDGGIGNIPGAMLGGIFLGLVESVGPTLFLDGLGIVAPYQLKDAIAFIMLVLVLIFRPTGILGERMAVKKA